MTLNKLQNCLLTITMKFKTGDGSTIRLVCSKFSSRFALIKGSKIPFCFYGCTTCNHLRIMTMIRMIDWSECVEFNDKKTWIWCIFIADQLSTGTPGSLLTVSRETSFKSLMLKLRAVYGTGVVIEHPILEIKKWLYLDRLTDEWHWMSSHERKCVTERRLI